MYVFIEKRESYLYTHYLLLPGPKVIKTFSMLNSAQVEILNAHKYKISGHYAFLRLRLAYNAIFPAHKC